MTDRFLVKLHYLREAGRQPRASGLEPVTMGLPLPKGQLFDPVHLAIDEGQGDCKPAQARILDRWGDGSVRWILLDWVSAPGVDSASLVLLATDEVAASSAYRQLRVRENAESGVVVETEALRIEFGTELDSLFNVDSAPSPTVVARGLDGERLVPARRMVVVEEQGPIRATVRVEWDLQDRDGLRVARVLSRSHVFAEGGAVKLEIALHNPRAAGHPGGIWTLGGAGALLLEAFDVSIPLDDSLEATGCRVSTAVGQEMRDAAVPLSLVQASSGGVNWNSRNHMGSDGEVRLPYRGFRLSSGAEESSGLRATPAVSVHTPDGWLGLAMQHFWQNSPKSIEIKRDRLDLGLLPGGQGYPHEIQGGERKTHTLVLAYGGGDFDPLETLDWGRSPLVARAEPHWYKEARAVPFLTPASEDSNEGYKRLVQKSLDPAVGFVAKREAVDEYGWRHFGDLYGDHESAFHEGPEVFLSHYNNQYDAVAGFATQFFRQGGLEWYFLMDELARHVVDIDLYHTTDDKSTYNGGQFWHTIHYIDAGASTHRAYPPGPEVNGGGPSTGNLYTHGLLLHYYLTGSHLSHEAVLSLGQYVIDADDGRQTIFRFLDRGYTGHVSESGFDGYHGPGRSPANAISALLDAYRLNREARFLEKAEQLIRRCIHPRDDLEDQNLWDAEHRWFYTMFLQTLGKYLLLKFEYGQLDAMFHYGRASLLRYAGWAAENERPYLERPDILQFPTETWAAQDMRKCELLNVASLFAESPANEQLRARARFFFDQSVDQLEKAKTSSYCRPLVLLLSNGASQAYFDRPVEAFEVDRPPAEVDFGQPERFQTQKHRALKRAKVLIAVSAVTAMTAGVFWLLSL